MKPTILLIEDSEDDVFFMRRALKLASLDYPLDVVSDGQAALDYVLGVRNNGERDSRPAPGLVLLDLRLPVVPGLEVLRQLRGQPRYKFVPVVVLTSSKLESDMSQAYELGANSFLVKPADASTLVHFVKNICEYWLGLNQVPPNEGNLGGEAAQWTMPDRGQSSRSSSM